MSSDIFGLIVGNVGLASSKELLDQIRRELQKARKKSYTLSVGRLNPAKLANFETIECFVIVGCAEGGVVDSKVSEKRFTHNCEVDDIYSGFLATYHYALGATVSLEGTGSWLGSIKVDTGLWESSRG